MFTGLVAEQGRVTRVHPRGSARVLTVECSFPDVQLGESIACDGVCLTVERVLPGAFEVAAGDETLRLTTLGSVQPGARLHLERALRAADRLGGHIVQGHVDGLGTVRAVQPGRQWTDVAIEVPTELARYVARKGSICVDGVSLTVNEVEGAVFHVGIIPHTQAVTRVAALRPGDAVNIEVDVVAKYVERLLGGFGATGLSLDKLRAAGFA